MGLGYYTTCVRWVRNRHGIIKLYGKQVVIGGRQIHVPGLPKDISEIEYFPQTRVGEMRRRCDESQEMRREEIEALDRWLARVFKWLID